MFRWLPILRNGQRPGGKNTDRQVDYENDNHDHQDDHRNGHHHHHHHVQARQAVRQERKEREEDAGAGRPLRFTIVFVMFFIFVEINLDYQDDHLGLRTRSRRACTSAEKGASSQSPTGGEAALKVIMVIINILFIMTTNMIIRQ